MDNQGVKNNNGKDCKIRVINLGLRIFYDAISRQGAKVTDISWRPPVKAEVSEEIKELLDDLL